MQVESNKKRETHERIVASAARLFRDKGYSACGVDAVMNAAGLTAGGFYSHFKNKDALLAEALRRCLSGPPTDPADATPTPPSRVLEDWVRRYATKAHRDQPEVGCAIPSLAAEVARQGPDVRTAFTDAFLDQTNAMASKMGKRSAKNVDAAIVATAAAAGAILLARAINDPELSERVLRVVRDAFQDKD